MQVVDWLQYSTSLTLIAQNAGAPIREREHSVEEMRFTPSGRTIARLLADDLEAHLFGEGDDGFTSYLSYQLWRLYNHEITISELSEPRHFPNPIVVVHQPFPTADGRTGFYYSLYELKGRGNRYIPDEERITDINLLLSTMCLRERIGAVFLFGTEHDEKSIEQLVHSRIQNMFVYLARVLLTRPGHRFIFRFECGYSDYSMNLEFKMYFWDIDSRWHQDMDAQSAFTISFRANEPNRNGDIFAEEAVVPDTNHVHTYLARVDPATGTVVFNDSPDFEEPISAGSEWSTQDTRHEEEYSEGFRAARQALLDLVIHGSLIPTGYLRDEEVALKKEAAKSLGSREEAVLHHLLERRKRS